VPPALQGAINLGFMILPLYRAWVILVSVVVCFSTWFVIERTRLGSKLRAATENAPLLQAFGVNVPLLIAATYGGGVALAALAGCSRRRHPRDPAWAARSSSSCSPSWSSAAWLDPGAIVSGLLLGVVEGFTKVLIRRHPTSSSS
jgi:branched-chain amino acid transport system permease protein